MFNKLSKQVYDNLFKRSSTFFLTIIVSSFFFERAYDQLCEAIFEKVNNGRLWKHIKHRYENDIYEFVKPETDSTNSSSAPESVESSNDD